MPNERPITISMKIILISLALPEALLNLTRLNAPATATPAPDGASPVSPSACAPCLRRFGRCPGGWKKSLSSSRTLRCLSPTTTGRTVSSTATRPIMTASMSMTRSLAGITMSCSGTRWQNARVSGWFLRWTVRRSGIFSGSIRFWTSSAFTPWCRSMPPVSSLGSCSSETTIFWNGSGRFPYRCP